MRLTGTERRVGTSPTPSGLAESRLTGNSKVVAFCGDESYCPGLVVAVASTLKWLPEGSSVEVVVFDEGLSERTKREIQRVVADAPAVSELHIVRGFASTGYSVPTPDHLTAATYARLLLPEVLDSHAVAIYLDADMLVRNTIEPLFEIDIGDAVVAACVDIGVPTVAEGLDDSYRDTGRDGCDPYINAGMLLMNPRRWRSDHLVEKILSYTTEWQSQVRYGDQDGINAVCGTQMLILDGIWNYQVRVEAERSRGHRGFRLGGVAIIHFNGPKPWASLGWLGGRTVALRTWAAWWWFAVTSSALPTAFRARMVRLLLRNAVTDIPRLGEALWDRVRLSRSWRGSRRG